MISYFVAVLIRVPFPTRYHPHLAFERDNQFQLDHNRLQFCGSQYRTENKNQNLFHYSYPLSVTSDLDSFLRFPFHYLHRAQIDGQDDSTRKLDNSPILTSTDQDSTPVAAGLALPRFGGQRWGDA